MVLRSGAATAMPVRDRKARSRRESVAAAPKPSSVGCLLDRLQLRPARVERRDRRGQLLAPAGQLLELRAARRRVDRGIAEPRVDALQLRLGLLDAGGQLGQLL